MDIHHSQENMTNLKSSSESYMSCFAEPILKLLAGKWKPQILWFAARGVVRFNTLLRDIPGSNKQSLSVALRELEEADILHKEIIQTKPLHIEYSLTERGKEILPIFKLASTAAKRT